MQLHVYTHVREDAISLFGFHASVDKMLFEKLIAVSGIGPSVAIKAMGGMTAADLAAAIRSGAIEQLVRIPGIGKKTAERMVLELRDKLDFAVPARSRRRGPCEDRHSKVHEEDVISALMNFGATRASGEAAVVKARSTTESNEFDALFRRALKIVRIAQHFRPCPLSPSSHP